MSAAIRAGIAYFALVFAAGVLLGSIRVVVLTPVFGELASVLIELPVILGLSWMASCSLVRCFAVPGTVAARFIMGGVALVCLFAAEVALAAAAFGQSPATFAQNRGDPAAATGLAGQLLFALFPLVQSWRGVRS